jgi:hypothetical protein
MQCPSCAYENPAAQKFGGNCGAPLSPAAAERLPLPASYTPPHLAQRSVCGPLIGASGPLLARLAARQIPVARASPRVRAVDAMTATLEVNHSLAGGAYAVPARAPLRPSRRAPHQRDTGTERRRRGTGKAYMDVAYIPAACHGPTFRPTTRPPGGGSASGWAWARSCGCALTAPRAASTRGLGATRLSGGLLSAAP